mmetsp:Transcript_878/g.1311  ORF Transcript_878/g.1311 Transcript_878/m.1311 type:complete len:453 (+) Transcript_878:76-1434(+)
MGSLFLPFIACCWLLAASTKFQLASAFGCYHVQLRPRSTSVYLSKRTNVRPSTKGEKKESLASSIPLPNSKSHRSTPPWQIISSKERKKNVALLKERREMLSQGLPDPGLPSKAITRSIKFTSEADRAFYSWKRFSFPETSGGMNLVGSYSDQQMPPKLGVPEVAFLGRSNVGKSSLLNKLVSSCSADDNSQWARVSKTPGATASLNMYALLGKKRKNNNILLGFADLPGFGYAKLSKETKQNIEVTAERYLDKRKELALVILLVDARRLPSDDDRAVMEALYENGRPICVVATKADKIMSSSTDDIELNKNLIAIQKGLGLPEGQPLTVSSVSGLGIKDLWRIIIDTCEDHVAELKSKAEQGASFFEQEDATNDEWQEDTLVDDESMVYSQGYDWQGTIDAGSDDFYNGDERQWEEDYNRSNEELKEEIPTVVNLKSLKKVAREKLRRGDV